ncbi:MAG: CocE/NonD family hydrolase [Fimbriimonadaceae bacterium]
MNFSFAGSDAGKNVYERKADGSFVSATTLNVMGTIIKSDLKGKFKGKKLVSFELVEQVATNSGKITYAGGRYTASGSSGKKSGKLIIDTAAFLATYHPFLTSTVADTLSQSDPSTKKVKIFMLDGLVSQTFPTAFTGTREVVKGDAKVNAKVLKIELGPVSIDYPVDPSNRVLGMDIAAQKFQGVTAGYTDVFIDPVSKFPELSQPTFTTKKLSAVKIPMRDGVNLVADIMMPAEEGKYPVILSRTPYGREGQMVGADWWAKRGYVVVAQDVRGRHDSEGKWDPFMPERKDGFDTIDWITKQTWSDGKVGMIGASYVGLVQWAAAVERHPALKAIIPQVSPPDAFFNIPYDHGIFMLWGSLWWSNIVKDKVSNMSLAVAAMKNVDKALSLPLSKIDDKVLGRNIPWFDAWLKKDRPSAYKGYDYGKDMASVDIPALHISGWWDGDGIGTKINWATMARAGRTNQWLIYGPWTHAFNTTSKLGDVNYGSSAILELDSLYLRWFDTWLKGKDVGLEKNQPKVKVFVTGANQWRALAAWPDPASKQMTMYLGDDTGRKSGPTLTGTLAMQPSSKKPTSGYTYDPRKVVIPPQLKGELDLQGGSTVLELKGEDDFALYKSKPMTEPLEIGGPIELDLYFSTTAKDTDFFATLIDVDPKGVMRVIGQPGKFRAKYLSGWETPRLLTPGKTYRMRIDLWDTAHQFKTGHRLGLVVTSELFPMYARNLGLGESDFSATKMIVARQKIYHDAARPSALRFMILPKKQ